jgi:hypothetical protein
VSAGLDPSRLIHHVQQPVVGTKQPRPFAVDLTVLLLLLLLLLLLELAGLPVTGQLLPKFGLNPACLMYRVQQPMAGAKQPRPSAIDTTAAAAASAATCRPGASAGLDPFRLMYRVQQPVVGTKQPQPSAVDTTALLLLLLELAGLV